MHRVVGTGGAQLPLFGVEGIGLNFDNAGLQFNIEQRRGPLLDQAVHARAGHQVCLAGRQTGCGHHAMGVQHPYRVGAPGLADFRGGLQGLREPGVAYREVLGTVVKGSKRAVAGGHSAAYGVALF